MGGTPLAPAQGSGRPSMIQQHAAPPPPPPPSAGVFSPKAPVVGGHMPMSPTASAPASAVFSPLGRQVSKADVLADIDRVDGDITALERRLATLRRLEDEDDVEAMERAAAAKAPAGKPKPKKPLPLRVPAPPKVRTAFDDTPAAVVLAAVAADESASRTQAALDSKASSLIGDNHGRREAAEATIGLDVASMPSTPRPAGAPFEGAIAEVVARNAATHAALSPAVNAVLLSRRSWLRQRHIDLALEYRVRQARWLAGLAEQKSAAQHGSSQQLTSPRGGSRGGALGDGGVVRSAYEEELVMQRLARAERLKALHADPPTQILDPHELRWRTLGANTNALVHDPVQALRDEARVRPWSAAERRTFLEKFSLYGKQFPKIAAHLPLRSTADCVVWYYRHQKTDDGFTGKRKTQLKRRRQYAELKRTMGGGGYGAGGAGGGAAQPAGPADTPSAPPRSRAGATAEARQEKAALAAAARAAGKPVGLAARRLERQAAALAEAQSTFSQRDVETLTAAVRVHGKSFKAIATATGFTTSQVKVFWTAHRQSKDLDALAAQAAAAAATPPMPAPPPVVPVADPAAAAMASMALLSAFPGGLPPLLPHPALLAMAGGHGQLHGASMPGDVAAQHAGYNSTVMMQHAGMAAVALAAYGGAFTGVSAAPPPADGAARGDDGTPRSGTKHPMLSAVQFIQRHATEGHVADDAERAAGGVEQPLPAGEDDAPREMDTDNADDAGPVLEAEDVMDGE